MKTLFFLSWFLLILCNPYVQSQESKEDRFWLSYPAQHSGRFFLMLTQINVQGEITVRPLRIAIPDVPHESTIFFDSSKRLHILTANSNYYRIVVERDDLKWPSAKRMKVSRTSFSRFFWHQIFTVAHEPNPILVGSKPVSTSPLCRNSEILLGYNLDDSGRILPGARKISAPFAESICITSAEIVSDDGIASFFGNLEDDGTVVQYYQKISEVGAPLNKLYQVQNSFPDNLRMTNPLANDMRLIAYAVNNSGGGGDDYPDQLYVRQIHLPSGRLGTKFRINSPNQFIRSRKKIVMDYKGRFVIFSIGDGFEETCSIYFRAINPITGKPTGALKKLLPGVCGSITLIKDPK